MEEKALEMIKQSQIQKKDPREMSPLVLAYVGDAVFELLVRTRVLDKKGNRPVNDMNRDARRLVNAKSQAEMAFRVKDLFTEEEKAVFRRGRNAKSFTAPKNAVLIDYKHATGLEAVFGFLYLDGNFERVISLFEAGCEEERGD